MRSKFVLFFIISLQFSRLFGQQMEFRLSFSQKDLEIQKNGSYDIVQLANGNSNYSAEYLGKPQLGIRNINVLIPPGCEIKDVKYKIESEEQILGKYFIYPVQYRQISGGSIQQPFVDPDPKIYNSTKPYPDNISKDFSLCVYRDYSFATISFIPFKYIPLERTLYLIKDVTIIIEYKQKIGVVGKKRQRPYNKYDAKAFESISSIVVNPNAIYNYYSDVVGKIKNSKAKNLKQKIRTTFSPTALPSTMGSAVEYVIITNDYNVDGNYVGNFSGLFQEFADWKTKTGMPAKVVLVNDIKEHYSGCDIQEKIREFLKDAYLNWGTEYVLLGGDISIVPARLIPYGDNGDFNLSKFMPSDLYYSDIEPLDKNWNDNGNNIFCEDLVDHADQIADIAVGRAPVETVNELNTFIDKNYTYYRCSKAQVLPDDSYLGRQLNMAGIVNKYGSWSSNDNAFGLWVKYKVWELRNSSSQVNLMEYKNSYPSDWGPAYAISNGNLRTASAVAELNKGYGLINHYDHSDWNCLGAGATEAPKQFITSTDIMQLTNGRKNGVLYSCGCKTAPFDMEDCIGEKWLLNDKGGGVAFVGTATEIYSLDGGEHDRHFFEQLDGSNIHEIGTLLNKANLIASDQKYASRIYQLLSDPELQISTTQPNVLSVSYPNSISVGSNNIDVMVSGIPVGISARVCLVKANEVYVYDTFLNGGVATFNVTADTPGEMYITVTAPNCKTFEGIINVTNSTNAPHLYVSDITAGDCISSLGNCDGQVDAGETLDLVLKLKNTGAVQADGAQAFLVCSSPYITLSNSVNIPTSYPGDEIFTDPFRISVSNNIPDGTIVPCTLAYHDSDIPEEEFFIKIAAPEVDLTETKINNGGDGFQVGETVELSVKLTNMGSGTASGINAVLSTTSSNVAAITTASSSYGDVAAYSEKYGVQTFKFVVSNSYTGGQFNFVLNVTDRFGKNWIYNINLAPPSTVTAPNFQSYQNEIGLTWSPVAGVKGYNVYRSLTPSGEYTKLNKFIIKNVSAFRDYGLPAKMAYYYKISAVSTSGVESPLCPAIKAWTLLPISSNWPILPSRLGGIWGGMTLSDVDNDNQKEIFSANLSGTVLAWKPNGSELFDIDNNSSTVSGFYDIIGASFWSVPAIADINNDGKNELIVTTRNERSSNPPNPGKIYAFRMEDNNRDSKPDLLPGWPVSLSSDPNGDANLHGAVVSDLNGDGYMEVIAHSEEGPLFKVLKYDGSDYPGWPKTLSISGASYGMPAVADLDNDGFKEIIEGFADGKLYIWRHDGSNFGTTNQVFSTSSGKLLMPPMVVDIDKDGIYEIFVAAGAGTSGYIYSIKPDGSIKSGWNGKSIYFGYIDAPELFPCMAVGDLDQNGTLEVVYASGNALNIWDAAGNTWNLPGKTAFPIRYVSDILTESSGPLIADVDGDNQQEIIVPTLKSGKICAYKCDGSIPVGWPLSVNPDFTAEPAIDDINNDGKSEIVVGDGSGRVFVYETDGNSGLIDVGHYRFNNQNTGLFDKYLEKKKSGNITYNQEWSGIINVVGDVTVMPNVTLKIERGTVVKFSSATSTSAATSLIVNGTLIADAGAGTITFQRSNATGRWGNLVFDGAGAAGSKINNVTMSDGNEVRCLNGANVKILNSRLNNFYHGVYIYNAAPEIRDNDIENPYQNGIYGEASGLSPVIVHNTISKTNYSGQGVFLLNGTVPFVAYNDIKGCDYGVYFGGGAHAYFTEHVYLPYEEYKIFWPNNRFTNNNTALCAAWGGFISGGSSGYNSWYNTIKPSRSYDAYAYQSGTLIAQYNYWGGVTPKTYKDGTSTLDISNVLGLDPWEEPDVMSVSTTNNLATSKTALSKTSANGPDTDPVDLLEGVKLENEGRLDDAIAWYKTLVNADKYQSFALTELMRIKNRYSKVDILNYLEGLSKVKKNAYLLKLVGDNYLQNGQFDKAMTWFDNAVSSSVNKNEALDAKFSKLFAFINMKKDLGKSQELLSDIKKGDVSDFYFSSRIETAENLMSDPSLYSINKGENQDKFGQSLANSGIVTEYSLSQNYPNPFNPSTVINFEIPQASKVSLRVYDILGKEVATLVDGYRDMGRYSVQFNAKDLPSGMYIYEIRANNFIRSGKMLLLK